MGYTEIAVPITLTPASHDEVSDSIVVGLQHLLVLEYLVSEGVQAFQGYSEMKQV